MDGTWILHVSDNSFIDVGNVRAFSVDLVGFGCTPSPPPVHRSVPI